MSPDAARVSLLTPRKGPLHRKSPGITSPMTSPVLLVAVLLALNVIVDPNHIRLPSLDSSRRTRLIPRAALWPIAVRLEPPPLLRRIPLIDDHLCRHRESPRAGDALARTRSGVQPPMTVCPVDVERWRNPSVWVGRPILAFWAPALQPEPAYLSTTAPTPSWDRLQARPSLKPRLRSETDAWRERLVLQLRVSRSPDLPAPR